MLIFVIMGGQWMDGLFDEPSARAVNSPPPSCYWQELQPARLPEDTYRELQLLARQYYQMTSLLIKAKVDFNAICDQVLPGMPDLMNYHAGRHTLSDFVLRYHHTTHILEMGETRFRKDYCKWAEKRDTAIANVWRCSSLPQLKTVSLCFLYLYHARRQGKDQCSLCPRKCGKHVW